MSETTPPLIVSYNVDMKQAYVYDLSADHAYRPFVAGEDQSHFSVDFASFPCRPERLMDRFGVDPSCPPFCALDEFYFFRTILSAEADSPTVVLHPTRSYHASIPFEQFVEWFSRTYKIIFHRWYALEHEMSSEISDTSDDRVKKMISSPSMRYLFGVERNDSSSFTFREWMNRVNRVNRDNTNTT